MGMYGLTYSFCQPRGLNNKEMESCRITTGKAGGIRIWIMIHLLAHRNLLRTLQYSNKRITYEDQQYHIPLKYIHTRLLQSTKQN